MWEGTTYVSSTVDVLTSRVIFSMFSMLKAQWTYKISLRVPSAVHLVQLAPISQKPFVCDLFFNIFRTNQYQPINYSQCLLSVLCLFYISHNKVSLNSKNNVKQKRKKYNIIYYSLHCRPFHELGHYKDK